MTVPDPPSDRQHKDYDQSDVEHLMRVRQWRSYPEMISWLQRDGDADSKLTQGEVSHLVEDLSRLHQRGVEFIAEPVELYRELKRRSERERVRASASRPGLRR